MTESYGTKTKRQLNCYEFCFEKEMFDIENYFNYVLNRRLARTDDLGLENMFLHYSVLGITTTNEKRGCLYLQVFGVY